MDATGLWVSKHNWHDVVAISFKNKPETGPQNGDRRMVDRNGRPTNGPNGHIPPNLINRISGLQL